MSVNGQNGAVAPADDVLRWPGRVVAADDLRRRLNGHRELLLPPRAVVTPLALDELRALGVRVRREDEPATPPAAALWGYGQDRTHPMVRNAARALQGEGV